MAKHHQLRSITTAHNTVITFLEWTYKEVVVESLILGADKHF